MLLYENIKIALDIFFRYAFGVVLFFLALTYTIRECKKNFWRGIYLGLLVFGEAGLIFLVIYLFPWWFANVVIKKPEYQVIIRWIFLYITIVPFWWLLYTRKYGGRRGLFSSLIVLTVFLFGWQFDRWVGIIFISIPILAIFFFKLDRLAQVILPPAIPSPSSSYVHWQKTRAFIKYMLGIQYPVWVAKSKADRAFDTRISGSPFNKTGEPGILMTWSHQVAALSSGTNFGGIVGPGTVFTSRLQHPIALVDKRTQLRVTTTETVTKDGIRITAVIFMAFKV